MMLSKRRERISWRVPPKKKSKKQLYILKEAPG